jgi:hypothetical protein
MAVAAKRRDSPRSQVRPAQRNIRLDGFDPLGNSAAQIISRTGPVTISESIREHVILGIDARDIQAQKDRWLAENPSIKIIGTGEVKREPPNLLTRFGGRYVPRFSILLRYRQDTSGPVANGMSIPSSPAVAQSKAKKHR